MTPGLAALNSLRIGCRHQLENGDLDGVSSVQCPTEQREQIAESSNKQRKKGLAFGPKIIMS